MPNLLNLGYLISESVLDGEEGAVPCLYKLVHTVESTFDSLERLLVGSAR